MPHALRRVDTYDVEDDVGVSSETLDDLEVGVTANDSLVDTELGLKHLGFFCIADEDSDVELAALGMLEELVEDSTADIA